MKNVVDLIGSMSTRVIALLLGVVGSLVGCLAPLWVVTMVSIFIVIGTLIVWTEFTVRGKPYPMRWTVMSAFGAALCLFVTMWAAYGIASLPW